ncbi:MAG: hypothetical protein EOP83_33305, partial [Verrucomicrobiaceae bacterium]
MPEKYEAEFVIGTRYFRDSDSQPWEKRNRTSKYLRELWFAGHPQDILARLGITTERRRAEDLSSL